MANFARVLPWLVLVFALAGLALGLHEWSHPPFSDEQLKTSPADTWEVAVSTTRVFGIVFLGLGMICVVLARKADTATMSMVCWLAALACLATLAVFLRNHIELAQRAAALMGREPGPAWGLL